MVSRNGNGLLTLVAIGKEWKEMCSHTSTFKLSIQNLNKKQQLSTAY